MLCIVERGKRGRERGRERDKWRETKRERETCRDRVRYFSTFQEYLLLWTKWVFIQIKSSRLMMVNVLDDVRRFRSGE